MTKLQEFIRTFDPNNPNWSLLPDSFPDCDLDGLTSSEVGKFLAIKTVWELNQPQRPQQRSRIWKDPEGYRYLVPWSNAVLLRYLIRKHTESLPKSEYRRKSQLDDAGRSVVRNIEEGYKRATTSEYIQFLGYTQGSLEEVKGDFRELAEDEFLQSQSGSSLADLSIDLGEFHRAVKGDKGKYRKVQDSKGPGGSEATPKFTYQHLTVLYPPLKDLKAEDLTIEMFVELINKTDYLLRRLVESLEKRLFGDQKAYRVEQARIRSKLRWKR